MINFLINRSLRNIFQSLSLKYKSNKIAYCKIFKVQNNKKKLSIINV